MITKLSNAKYVAEKQQTHKYLLTGSRKPVTLDIQVERNL
jgi:hypothetical protein